MGSCAESVDCRERLFTELLREEEGGNDDGECDENESERGAGGTVFYFVSEPVVGVPGDDGEDDGTDDGGEEGLEDENAEDKDAEGEEEEGDLLPGWRFAALLHEVVAPLVGLDATGHGYSFGFILLRVWYPFSG
jgi:hypothetical protein